MRLALRKVVFILGFSLMLNQILDFVKNPSAEAAYKWNNALETVGIAAGIGSVIGFSTIAFYDEPFSHMTNMLMGAGAGMIVGLGAAAYLMASDDDEEISPDELLPPSKKTSDPKQLEKQLNHKNPAGNGYHAPRLRPYAYDLPGFRAQTQNLGSAAFAQRGWSVVAKVVELRF